MSITSASFADNWRLVSTAACGVSTGSALEAHTAFDYRMVRATLLL
jgi:hypothetical protein